MDNFQFHNADELVITQTSKTTFILATGGGALDATGSFGWVLATTTQVLAACGGLTAGKDPNLFQTAAFAMVSGLVFLHFFATKYNIQIICKLKLILDSESYLKRLESSLSTD